MAKIATNQERLNQLFDADPRNDTAIGLSLGVSKQTISAWRNGTRSPKKSMLLKIAESYSTTPEWLLGWDLPAPDISVAPVSLSGTEKELIMAFRAADDRARADAMNTLKSHPKT
jgi:transcriptional regulator with XRE-family HTH domain